MLQQKRAIQNIVEPSNTRRGCDHLGTKQHCPVHQSQFPCVWFTRERVQFHWPSYGNCDGTLRNWVLFLPCRFDQTSWLPYLFDKNQEEEKIPIPRKPRGCSTRDKLIGSSQ